MGRLHISSVFHVEFIAPKKVTMLERLDVVFCDLRLFDNEAILLECESLEMSFIILAVNGISYSTGFTP